MKFSFCGLEKMIGSHVREYNNHCLHTETRDTETKMHILVILVVALVDVLFKK